MDLSKLQSPFDVGSVEWRVGRSGLKDGKPWAMVLAYVTNRAIMDRLDEVCGAANWRNEFREWHVTSQLCGISIRCGEEWITKWDGADITDVEGTKGGLSDSQKRCAVQWGIGRYLYDLEEGRAQIISDKKPGCHRDCIKGKNGEKDVWFYWEPPRLPEWAIPKAVAPPKAEAPASNGAPPPRKKDSEKSEAEWMTFCDERISAAKGNTKVLLKMLGQINGKHTKAADSVKKLMSAQCGGAIVNAYEQLMRDGMTGITATIEIDAIDPALIPPMWKDALKSKIESVAMKLLDEEAAAATAASE